MSRRWYSLVSVSSTDCTSLGGSAVMVSLYLCRCQRTRIVIAHILQVVATGVVSLAHCACQPGLCRAETYLTWSRA